MGLGSEGGAGTSSYPGNSTDAPPVMSFLCPRPTIRPHSESAQHRLHRDQRHCPPREELEGRRLSSGSLWLISLSPATRGRKYHIHMREQGSEAELAPQHQRNIQFPDLEGHEKGKGTRVGMLGPAVRSPG